MVTGECEIARENHLITNYLISESEVVTENLKLRHGSVNAVRPRFEIFPITTELSRLLCCLLYGLQTEKMKNYSRGSR